MFEALPPSFTAAGPSRARPIAFALLLHAASIGLAVNSTASSGMSVPQVPRDTIRVELAIVEERPDGAPPRTPGPAMQSAPTMPKSQMTGPSVELPQPD